MNEYQKLYCGAFEVNEREHLLYDRVVKYFKDTDDVEFAVSNQFARELRDWCEINGYSKGDLNRTKSYVQKYNVHTIN